MKKLTVFLLLGLTALIATDYLSKRFRLPSAPLPARAPTYDDALSIQGKPFPFGCTMIQDAMPGLRIERGTLILPVGTFQISSPICFSADGIALYGRHAARSIIGAGVSATIIEMK